MSNGGGRSPSIHDGLIQIDKRRLWTLVTPDMGIESVEWIRNFAIGWCIFFSDKRRMKSGFKNTDEIADYIKGLAS